MPKPVRAASLSLALLALALPALALPAAAAEPKSVGSFHDWQAYTFQEGKNTVCYIASRPKKVDSKGKRGDVHLLVTQRPAENSYDVVSVVAGYTFKPKSDVTLQIGTQTFKLFTKDDTAWAADTSTDKAIVDALRKGASLTVKGTSQKGTDTTDTYSLNGAGQAYQAINDACKVKR